MLTSNPGANIQFEAFFLKDKPTGCRKEITINLKQMMLTRIAGRLRERRKTNEDKAKGNYPLAHENDGLLWVVLIFLIPDLRPVHHG